MRGAVMYGPGDVWVEQREEPRIGKPTDAILRVSAACVCGSNLWPQRGVEKMQWPAPMGHEYAGIVEEVGNDVQNIKPGQFAVGSFWASDNTCEICRAGRQRASVNRVPMGILGRAGRAAPRAPWPGHARRRRAGRRRARLNGQTRPPGFEEVAIRSWARPTASLHHEPVGAPSTSADRPLGVN